MPAKSTISTDTGRWKLLRAVQLYDHSWVLIQRFEFPGVTCGLLLKQVERLRQKGWSPPKGTEKLPLRAETEPEELAKQTAEWAKENNARVIPEYFRPFLNADDGIISILDASPTEERDKDSQIQYLRKRITQLEQANGDLFRAIGEQRELREGIAAALVSVKPLPFYKYPRAERSKTPVIPVLKWSDLHIGEVIRKEETEGFGEFNYQIAEDRFFKILESFLQWVEVQRLAYRIETCTIFALGDYVSGNIHGELIATNEFPLPVQTAKAGLLMGEGIRRVAPHFERLDVWEEGADNHGRLQKKPQAKQKYENNMSFLVHTIANQYISNLSNVTIHEGKGMKLLAEVAGHKFLLEHGDTVRAWMGIPWYGVSREKGREAIRRMNTDRGFHYQSIAHWHVPNFVEGMTTVNGSLSGTSEYDHAAGRHAPPCQVAFLVHPKHGVFNFVAFTVKA